MHTWKFSSSPDYRSHCTGWKKEGEQEDGNWGGCRDWDTPSTTRTRSGGLVQAWSGLHRGQCLFEGRLTIAFTEDPQSSQAHLGGPFST